jgi:hypothetical protein
MSQIDWSEIQVAKKRCRKAIYSTLNKIYVLWQF